MRYVLVNYSLFLKFKTFRMSEERFFKLDLIGKIKRENDDNRAAHDNK